MATRIYECSVHGPVEEDPKARNWHCCFTTGHRCGWTGDPDDNDGCHKPVIPPTSEQLAEMRDVKAPTVEEQAAAAPALHVVPQATRVLLSTGLSREALQPLSDAVDEAVEHVLSGESAVCQECGARTGDCPTTRLQAIVTRLRVDGLLPWGSKTAQLLATVPNAAIREIVEPAFLERFPEAEWRQHADAWELWSRPALIAPLSSSDDAIETG